LDNRLMNNDDDNLGPVGGLASEKESPCSVSNWVS
jgi:hypothetical protein